MPNLICIYSLRDIVIDYIGSNKTCRPATGTKTESDHRCIIRWFKQDWRTWWRVASRAGEGALRQRSLLPAP